jgi:sulfur carrier protein ThiS
VVKVAVEFAGFPTIYDLFPVGQHEYNVAGGTIPDLVRELIFAHGDRLAEALLDPRTKSIDPTIQVAINAEFVRREDIPRVGLRTGDRITFFRLLAGG